jgi:hypothetical protein
MVGLEAADMRAPKPLAAAAAVANSAARSITLRKLWRRPATCIA